MMRRTNQRAARPPADGMREAPFSARIDGDDGMTLDGYGAVFNRETVIDSWEGRFKEKIAPGSMKRSFKETPPKIQFDHGRHVQIGSIPIARLVSITEEVDAERAPDGGAHIIGRFFPGPLIDLVREAIAGGAIDGMSFRFSVLDEEWHTPDGKKIRDERELLAQLERTWDAPDEELLTRTLRQVRVPEMGPVVWPAYTETSVGVRSSDVIDLELLRQGDPEQRKRLGLAMLIADEQASNINDDDSQRSTPVAGEHEVNVVDNNDRQRSTPVAGEHQSIPLNRVQLQLRNQRQTLINIHKKGSRQ